ncbi:MAG: hypothetical protein J6A59_02940 [Lachnospiraceae bacterium]|nr:hypothetical protein [Lachnospiraceae bacterium]
MNKVITIFIKGETYNPMYKWNSVEEFNEALKSNTNIPAQNSIVVEAYVDDNFIDAGNTFDITVQKLKLIFGLE